LPTGPLPPNPAELLAGPKMPSLLQVAEERFDIVIVDAPPVMDLADAPLLASVASGTLLVLSASETRKGAARETLKRLNLARAQVIGAALNKFDPRKVGFTYGYGYGYGYDDPRPEGQGDEGPRQLPSAAA
jgi:polysaccharide biosynthesis transport protein